MNLAPLIPFDQIPAREVPERARRAVQVSFSQAVFEFGSCEEMLSFRWGDGNPNLTRFKDRTEMRICPYPGHPECELSQISHETFHWVCDRGSPSSDLWVSEMFAMLFQQQIQLRYGDPSYWQFERDRYIAEAGKTDLADMLEGHIPSDGYGRLYLTGVQLIEKLGWEGLKEARTCPSSLLECLDMEMVA